MSKILITIMLKSVCCFLFADRCEVCIIKLNKDSGAVYRKFL